MTRDLEKKSIIVTGAGAGIGRAAAIACANAGARVVVADYNAEAGAATVAEIEKNGGESFFVAVDISKEEMVANLVEQTIARFGRLDGAFNNAGIPPVNLPLHELTGEQWRRAQAVNVEGLFYCLKHEVIAMLKTGGGAIVNTASTLARVAIPNDAEYIATKGGVTSVTRAAAIDYGSKNIRVNAILPGLIRTAMVEEMAKDPKYAALQPALLARHPIGRFGFPIDIAEAAVWLLSDRSSFMTGAEVAVDGGYTALG